MAEKKDKTVNRRVKKCEAQKRKNGLVPVSFKIWVRKELEGKVREMLARVRVRIDKL